MANMDKLLTIAEMTNKYHFASTETWAVDALYNVISGLHGLPQPQYDLAQCSSAWMKQLLEVALLCKHTALRDRAAEQWIKRIGVHDLRPIHALEIADRSGIRRLQGYAYYAQLLEMGDSFDAGVAEDGKQYSRSRLGAATATAVTGQNGNGENSTLASLTREQKQRLLSGYWSLSWLWHTLRTEPPKFQRPDECTRHQEVCMAMLNKAWRDLMNSEATMQYAPGDVLSRLHTIYEKLLIDTDLTCMLTRQCRQSALKALNATIKEVREGLAVHFVNLTCDQEKQGVEANAAEELL